MGFGQPGAPGPDLDERCTRYQVRPSLSTAWARGEAVSSLSTWAGRCGLPAKERPDSAAAKSHFSVKACYLLRFDDICPAMNWTVWAAIEPMLERRGISPLIAVV